MLTPTPSLAAAAVIVEIPPHESVIGIGQRLYQADVIRSRAGFVLWSLVRGSARRLRAGEYEVPQGAATPQVLALIESGKVRPHIVVHREGATVAELSRELESERLATAAEVLRVASDPTLLATLGIEGPSAEGYLFPDTYQFVRGMTVEEMLTRMVQRLRGKLTPEIEAKAEERRLTTHQLLTLASIIEREAVDAREMRLISAVFWNRLALDMPLQADPTVQYALRKERQALTRADLQTDHAFNTYLHAGLPPGPIASPSLPAIQAALDPAPVRYLYFVATNDRHHHFSTSIEEHKAAVARYRLTHGR